MTPEPAMPDRYCLHVGGKVSDFTLETFDPVQGYFSELSLSDLMAAGKWTVLFFYPADFTSACTTELAALSRKYEEFKKLGAEIVTVNTDHKFSHMAWRTHEARLKTIQYPMGSDPSGDIARLFRVYDAETGLTIRGTFIINPDGTLMNAEINFFNLSRDIDRLLRKVKANIYLASHGNEVCPPEWEREGDKTMTLWDRLVPRVTKSTE
jgi:peroxiredoxin (alkyl hydroperoxide reductase subunit C)